jgi:rSAM/selenodomain-associated transferase 2
MGPKQLTTGPGCPYTTDRRGSDPRRRHAATPEGIVARVNVSIIIPTLNEQDHVARAVNSALGTGAHEVIVVDGGSHDETCKLAGESGALVFSGPAGRAVQQNAGAHRATGDVLLFLHADNWLDPGSVEQIEVALADQTIPGGAFRQRIEADGLLYRLIERGNGVRVAWRGLPYGDQGIFVRRTLFDRIGGFPETRLMEDLLFGKALRQTGRPILLPGPIHVSPRRWERHGVVRQTLRNWGLLAARSLGAPPDRLARHYPPHGD